MDQTAPAARPFASFAPPLAGQSPLSKAITAATRRPERACVAALLPQARVPAGLEAPIAATTSALITSLRADARPGAVQSLVQEYALSSPEGVALMCLAEALLRIPDVATRDALIRDKIAPGDWRGHVGKDRPLFVNAASWGLLVTGRLVQAEDEAGLGASLTRLIARMGEPVIRRAVDAAMRMMGEQFVTGETIEEALRRAAPREAKGFAFSYDMLGEAAMTAADADRYNASYEQAIAAIGQASAGRGIHAGPGISIKLSALHPRYARAKVERVKAELLPRVKALCLLAKGHDIGLNIDAEEADRLELSLDLLEALALDPELAGWNGLGFVVQAYQKRCPFVIDWIVDLARRSNRRIMVRLVKGAYWDAEIKRAQVDGLPDFPVYTQKVHTDLAYVACARKLLAARDVVFPQFATHNAQSVATVLHLAGPDFAIGDYEFQCLHGMGEGLYDQVVGADKLNRPCRVYAPVGTHETLLAYLVRRLLENGANSSFVNRINDPAVSVEELAADPVALVAASADPGAPHPAVALPTALFADRRNSAGLDLADEAVLADLAPRLDASARQAWQAGTPANQDGGEAVCNPADRRDVVGHVWPATPEAAAAAVARAQGAAPVWAATPVAARAAMLERAATLLEEQGRALLGLIMREAGKTAANAVGEVREAVDFLRYYAVQARSGLAHTRPLGPVVCISPWNFPLAIFAGQVAAALVAGNPVLAKPAEETPLIAAQMVALLHQAGVPADVVQLVPGDGAIGAALVEAPGVAGVLFTGSTEVARIIQRTLATRSDAMGRPIPLIAETGGQNAMIVDSSALAEQVVADVIASAFDSAGQRCSALRVLCLQEDVADRTLAMLRGAMAELAVGNPDTLATDIGPVITAQARDGIEAHVAAMAARGARIHRLPLPASCGHGTFVAPTLIEIPGIEALGREVFGPVLHVVRYAARDLDRLIAAINATGYGLTFGLHTRLDETMARVTRAVEAGNLYVNRNTIGAVVGVQPFGGRGLSGTGPKAGGPLYLARLVRGAVATPPALDGARAVADPAVAMLADWLESQGHGATAQAVRADATRSRLGIEVALPGPVGESNRYRLAPRGAIALYATTADGLWRQLGAVLATGNHAVILPGAPIRALPAGFPAALATRVTFADGAKADLAAALVELNGEDQARVLAMHAAQDLAAREGMIVALHAADDNGAYPLDLLLEEVSLSINTTAAGGNASLMAMV
ncbi:trifunctional transcriptional regulator/proline dehydrogenase/L-glutamate gamma-semialdehyde dehydrogenase [Novosphingobium sp. SG720]|uniref:trifunctional transcriptional regulator/proline dehydrogenase/L-glutamate gamma-semialdehyde dehydrogenase n=1 Tax=Novosphingobium sp. SG720 TaxID=2586998 RepID=UPI0014475A29|nr:trifunctional transcriptional regulator/proline dehydrogenase/L-glutamate gamma-semialdehyde dehydrogenase [Novosphingobium sp. SG720]NKJ41931.1 RHH-type proline utilization regulon transcriptional repressor/proline dehydrogenase/delta 1-pyrroline-5-carboxylate dehydrogenase [Novosphingobium sp. SG720]